MAQRTRGLTGLLRAATAAGVLVLMAGCGGASGSTGGAVARHTTAETLADAVVAAVRAKGSFTTRMSQSTDPVVVSTAVTLTDGGQDYAVTATTPTKMSNLVVMDDTYYLRTTTVSTAATRWRELSLDQVEQDPQLGSSVLEAGWPAKFDALRLAKTFRAASPTEVDQEEITVYTLVVGDDALERMLRLDLLPEQRRAELVKNLEGQSATIVVNLGVDDLPRKVAWAYGADSSVTVTTHYSFTGWGTTHVVAPPADLVDHG